MKYHCAGVILRIHRLLLLQRICCCDKSQWYFLGRILGEFQTLSGHGGEETVYLCQEWNSIQVVLFFVYCIGGTGCAIQGLLWLGICLVLFSEGHLFHHHGSLPFWSALGSFC